MWQLFVNTLFCWQQSPIFALFIITAFHFVTIVIHGLMCLRICNLFYWKIQPTYHTLHMVHQLFISSTLIRVRWTDKYSTVDSTLWIPSWEKTLLQHSYKNDTKTKMNNYPVARNNSIYKYFTVVSKRKSSSVQPRQTNKTGQMCKWTVSTVCRDRMSKWIWFLQ